MKSMKFNFCISILLINFISTSSCKREIQKSDKISITDSTKLAILNDSVHHLFLTNIDAALEKMNEEAIICKSNKYEKRLATCYKAMVIYYGMYKGDMTKAKNMLDSCLTITNKLENQYFKNKGYLAQGYYYYLKKDLSLATNAFLESIKTNGPPIDSNDLLEAYNTLSIIYSKGRYHREAVEFMKKTRSVHKLTDDTLQIINDDIGLHNNLFALGDTTNALLYLKEAYKYSGLNSFSSLRMNTDLLFATYYYNKKNHDSILYYVNEAISTKRNVGEYNISMLNMFYALAAYAYSNKNEYDSSTKYLNAIRDKDKYSSELEKPYYFEAQYNLLRYQGKKDSALKIADKLYSWAKTRSEISPNEHLLHYEQEINKLKVIQIEQNKNFEIERQKKYTIALLLLSLFLFALFYGFYQFWKNKKELETLKWEQKTKDIEIANEKALSILQTEERNRIAQEMHDDLGSSITSIAMAVEMVKHNPLDITALDIIDTSSAELGQIVNEIVWSLNQRNDNLQSLIAYSRRFANTFLSHAGISLIWEDKCIDTEKTLLLGHIRRSIYLIIKELLNNIVKHAHANEVNIVTRFEKNIFYCSIKDNGIGFDSKNIVTKTGNNNGLENMKITIKKLQGSITWLNDRGTKVDINMLIIN